MHCFTKKSIPRGEAERKSPHARKYELLESFFFACTPCIHYLCTLRIFRITAKLPNVRLTFACIPPLRLRIRQKRKPRRGGYTQISASRQTCTGKATSLWTKKRSKKKRPTHSTHSTTDGNPSHSTHSTDGKPSQSFLNTLCAFTGS